MKNYKISIIIPVYNGEKYIKECLDSIINQTYVNFEIIIVDDGSNDNTLNIIHEYNNEKVKVFSKENGGVSSARNFAIKHVSGDYIMFVDSDDYLTNNNSLSELVNNLEGYDVINFGNNIVDNNKITLQSLNINEDSFINGSSYFNYVLKDGNGFSFYFWRYLFKKELFDDIVFPDGRIFEDTNTIYKVLLKASNIRIIDKPLYSYRYNNSSLTKIINYKICDDMIYIIKTTANDINNIDIDASTRKLLLNCLSYGYFSVIGAMSRLSGDEKNQVKKLLKDNKDILNYAVLGKAKRIKNIINFIGIDFMVFLLKLKKMIKI